MNLSLALQSLPNIRHSTSRIGTRAGRLANRAVDALVAEALLTPKPALVDRRGSGAHGDLDLDRLLQSALSLRAGFKEMAECAAGRVPTEALREELGRIGRNAEKAMLAATGGSNAHRGAIWVLGLLIAARALRGSNETPGAAATAEAAAKIARLPDRGAPISNSNGSRVCEIYGVGGARGEARSGFPHVIHVGLPALRCARSRGIAETHAQLDALLSIMTRLADTCLLHRGGRPALEAAQAGAQAVIAAGGTSTAAGWSALLALDADLLQRWASPGGSADLLAACLFLDT